MSRWLQAAHLPELALTKPTKPTEPSGLAVLSVESVLSLATKPRPAPALRLIRSAETALSAVSAGDQSDTCADPDILLALVNCNGPSTYGAAATTLGWPATRAWQAEARLRAAGLVRHDELGRACPDHLIEEVVPAAVLLCRPLRGFAHKCRDSKDLSDMLHCWPDPEDAAIW